MPGPSHEAEEMVWKDLDVLFAREANVTLWSHNGCSILLPPDGSHPLSSGFAYGTPNRKESSVGTIKHLRGFQYSVRNVRF